MKNRPKSIFLNFGDTEIDRKTDFEKLEGVTWSKQRVDKSDMEFFAANYNYTPVMSLPDFIVAGGEKGIYAIWKQKEVMINGREAVGQSAAIVTYNDNEGFKPIMPKELPEWFFNDETNKWDKDSMIRFLDYDLIDNLTGNFNDEF
jgi:hypothetical protein